MTPEEEFNKDVWYVLQKIKSQSLRRLKGEAIEYKINLRSTGISQKPEPMEEGKIVKKLIEWKVVKEIKPPKHIEARVGDYALDPLIYFYLEIIQPKFGEIYLNRKILLSKDKTEEIPQETKSIPVIKLENENLKWGKVKIPMRRGQGQIMEILLQNSRIFRGDKMVQRGGTTCLEVLRGEGGYPNEACVRNALKVMRAKIKKVQFPITKIYPQSTGNYIAIIKYNKER